MEIPTGEMTLRDGRSLGYCEFGFSEGTPVVYQHGWPACRLEACLYSEAAVAAGVRLISIDRPGFGCSQFLPKRTLLDWPSDVRELAGHLGLDSFHLLGHSGGGPYAAACARELDDLLKGVAIVAGLSPMSDRRTREGMRKMNQFLLTVGRPAPWLLDVMMKMTAKMAQDPEKVRKSLGDLPEVDRLLIERFLPEVAEIMGEAFVQGTRGATEEGRIYASPWGFELAEITVPVAIWQGMRDVNVPRSNSEVFHEAIGGSRLEIIEDEGHFSMAINQGERILRDLKTLGASGD